MPFLKHQPKVVLKGTHFKGLRWVLLCMSIVGAFGFEYSFDTPSAIKELMHEQFAKKYSEKQFEIFYSLLYSIMALPNIMLPLVLGLLVDKVILDFEYNFYLYSSSESA